MSDSVFGKVVSFDEGLGLGEVRADDGTRLQFHCVELADGSRTIDVGTSVRFRVVARMGRYEATEVIRA